MTKILVALFVMVLAMPAMAQNVGAIVASQTSSVAAAALADSTSSAAQAAVEPDAQAEQGKTADK